jgi:ubiquinone biosynthesis protein COQ9
MAPQSELANSILDTALRLASENSWEKLKLRHIANEMNISLNQIRDCYAQKDDLVEAWFDRADSTMLQAATNSGLIDMSMRERLYTLIMAWLDQLATYHKVTRDMLLYKLEPAHIHLQIQGILRISRTVQWLLEAAHYDSTHLRRIGEEVGLTSIYLATFMFWMTDLSQDQQRTRRFLEHRLRDAENLVNRFTFFRNPQNNRPQTTP